MQSEKQKKNLLAFLLITVVLLIAVSIYFYLIKYIAKEKHLLPWYIRNNKLEKLCFSDLL